MAVFLAFRLAVDDNIPSKLQLDGFLYSAESKTAPQCHIAVNMLRSGLLRAVRIRAALLTQTEAESERAESEGRSRTREWFSDGEHAEG